MRTGITLARVRHGTGKRGDSRPKLVFAEEDTRMCTRTTIGMLAVSALAVSACGATSKGATTPRPPAPVNLTVYIDNSRVSVSPSTRRRGARDVHHHQPGQPGRIARRPARRQRGRPAPGQHGADQPAGDRPGHGQLRLARRLLAVDRRRGDGGRLLDPSRVAARRQAAPEQQQPAVCSRKTRPVARLPPPLARHRHRRAGPGWRRIRPRPRAARAGLLRTLTLCNTCMRASN